MKIIIYQNREVYKEESKIGNDSENKVETLEFEFPEEYKDFTKYIEFQIKGGKYVDLIEDNKYVITREVAKYGKIKTQVVLKKNTENDVMVFKSDIFTLTVSNSINATENLVYTVGVDLIEKIVTKNNEQDARLDTLEADNTTNKENISNIQEEQTTQNNRLDSLEVDNTANKSDISNIKQEQITQNTNIQELQTDNTSNKAKIETLETKNTEQDTNIQKNTNEIKTINEKNKSQDTEITNIKSEQVTQNTNIQNNTEDIAAINKKDTSQDKLIEELQTKLEEVEAENVSLKNQIPSGEATGNPIHLSDSSDMKCEIVVKGNAEQETRSGKNKLKLTQKSETKNGLTIVVDKGKMIINGTATADTYILIYNNSDGFNVNGDYYFSTNVQNALTDTDKYNWINIYKNTTQLGYLNPMATGKQFGFENETITQISFSIKSGALCNNLTFEFQLEPGTSKTDFEPYGASPSPDYPSEIVTVGQNGSVEISVDNGLETTDTNYQSYTKVLPLQKEFVKIGDYEDTFVKVDGKWYEQHNIKKLVLDGTESWIYYNSGTFGVFYSDIVSVKLNTNNYLCTHFTKGNYTTTNNVILFTNSGRLHIRNDNISNATDFKSWLAEQYANGTPVIIYYILATPELIPCTAEQEEILNSFYTYKGITNVSMSGIGTLKVNYKKDLETIINNIATATVALGGNLNV